MQTILNSTFLQTLVTFVVGCAALITYFLQKRDKKRTAALMLLLEIQQVEGAAQSAREYIRQGDLEAIDTRLLLSDTWDQNKHLFSRLLDKDEWDVVTRFYNTARLLDNTIQRSHDGLDAEVEQIRANRQSQFAEITSIAAQQIADGKNKIVVMKEFQDKIKFFDELYMLQQNQLRYKPQKFVDDAQRYLSELETISTTSVGQKLKKISRHKHMWVQ